MVEKLSILGLAYDVFTLSETETNTERDSETD